MSGSRLTTIRLGNFSVWLLPGLPAVVFWGIGVLGAASLLAGLGKGSVVPGIDSMVDPGVMWSTVAILAVCGQVLGISTFFQPVRNRVLWVNFFPGYYFAVL